MNEVDIAKVIECVIFVVSLMLWGAFIMFIFARSRIDKWKDLYYDAQAHFTLAMEKYANAKNAERELDRLTEHAISMFRGIEYCRGYDPNTRQGRIAQAAFKHWIRIEVDKQRSEHYKTDKAAICTKESSQQS